MRQFHFIDKIINAADSIETYIQGLSIEEFKKSRLIIDAVIWNLELIGETAKNIPIEEKEDNPHIPWEKIIGFRYTLINEYDNLDLSEIWEIATVDTITLRTKCAEIKSK
jgi:uncharacterized protein with HEPN domain